MASMSIRAAACAGRSRAKHCDFSPSKLVARLPDSVPVRARKFRSGLKMSVSAARTELSRAQPRSVEKRETRRKTNRGAPIDHEKIDQWMPEAVVEIVKNLKQAPLLMQVYGNSSGSIQNLKTERAVEEEWLGVKESWTGDESPEGVILVEEIAEEEEGGETSLEEAATKAWGILIQGRGCEYGPACYLLKTSRVRSGLGSGCTHFCLTKVTSFRESAFSQLSNCLLVQ